MGISGAGGGQVYQREWVHQGWGRGIPGIPTPSLVDRHTFVKKLPSCNFVDER